MGNIFLRDLSIYWSLIHLALIFVMLFRSRFSRKRTWILSGAGIGVLLSLIHIYYILTHGWKEYEEKELGEMLSFANAAASIITTRKGALRVMPRKEEILCLCN